MPPRLALSKAASRRIAAEPFVCTSCLLDGASINAAVNPRARPGHASSSRRQKSFLAARSHLQSNSKHLNKTDKCQINTPARRQAHNGSLASTTAINPPSTVPAAYLDLHKRLQDLQSEASSYVDLSRIQLALRSLETSTPSIRIALLGLGSNGALAARKLARVLLSDPLADEEAWETEMLETAHDGRSLLLRYGDAEDVVQHNPLMQEINIPSPFLQRNNVEVLVTTLNANGKTVGKAEQSELEDAILVPPLTIPTSAGGRVGFVRYPVHMALIVAEGVTGAVEYGRFPEDIINNELINAALSLPLQSSTGARSTEESEAGSAVDIDLATHALQIFRPSKENGAKFSQEWQTSRIPALTSWVAAQRNTETDGLTPAVKKLIKSVLTNTTQQIQTAEIAETALVTKTTIQPSKRAETLTAIATWSASAHRDLQINLNTAFISPSWNRTVWWRLLWRIDDVSFSAADILRQSWLTEAEQSIAYLSGCIAEAGLASIAQLKETGTSQTILSDDLKAAMGKYEASTSTGVETVAELLQTPTLLSRVQAESGVNPLFDPPWPQTIHLARQQMLHTLVPDLHRKAQGLLFRTLSTIGGSGALGAWLYIATSGLALYEAGAVASLGLVWGLRGLQKAWSKERDEFEVLVKEDGRRVLAEMETHLQKIAREGGKLDVRPEDAEEWEQARAAVQKCQEALKEIE